MLVCANSKSAMANCGKIIFPIDPLTGVNVMLRSKQRSHKVTLAYTNQVDMSVRCSRNKMVMMEVSIFIFTSKG